MTELMRRQVTGYALVNMEWRLAIQDFINHHSEEGYWEAIMSETGPTLDLYNKYGELTEQLKVSPIGSYNYEKERWTWAWANPAFNTLQTQKASTIKRYGAQYTFDELLNPIQQATEEEAEIYPIMATAVYGGTKPVIWLPGDSGKLCVIIEDDLQLPTITANTFANIISLASDLPSEIIDFNQSIQDNSAQRNYSTEQQEAESIITARFDDHSFSDIAVKDNKIVSIKYSTPEIEEEG